MDNFSLNNNWQINSPHTDNTEEKPEEVADIHDISLLEEKLIVKRRKQKVGEVIVRKEVETRMVHIPIRREKLIVETVGITTEHLTEIDLGESEVDGVKFGELGDTHNIYQAQSEFVSLQSVKDLLTKITTNSTPGNTKIRLEIITDNPESQRAYQNICDRHHHRQ
ncbi:DUF2382 domain-containing protein [Pleurocapsa sp. PCC 7319]|uniref:DUF2382 domain-containing protein n=1 Tax=Pleurocapsa sp. PCC 7319 TaxID=118161 RepID=UPI000347316B|nr:DUF2382 domain-containing protein [Pleurocapsa sp. PCC 7319]